MYAAYPTPSPRRIPIKTVALLCAVILGIVASSMLIFREVQGSLAAPAVRSMQTSFTRPMMAISGRPSLAVDATYVMWKGAKKKMMKRPKKKGYDSRRTPPVYDQLPQAPPQMVVVKAAKKD
mmetsp:Transcript_7116/g.10039  ORF Transcript_7116/g.10039 Transcript_7116/m.10039 type:complete len:122 (-) Transcript_7116:109-474(-)|eukprot:jgi/Bigna1/71729/fgenesh1_pg.16_\